MEIEVKSLAQIQKIFADEKPPFVALRNAKNASVVPWNSPSITESERFKAIEKKLRSPSTPDGVYYFLYKDSINKNILESVTAVGKGNYTNTVQVASIAATPSESVWSVHQALDILTAKNFLELRVKQLEQLVTDQASYIKELEEKVPQEQLQENGNFLGDLTQFANMVIPIVDGFMKLEKQKLELKERQLNERGAAVAPVDDGIKYREDGGVSFDDPHYPEYFDTVYNQGGDDLLDYELNVLEQNNPNLYAQFVEHYKIELQDATTHSNDATEANQ